ncbi:MAG: hypothetical protein JWN64_740 [Parcubacteria group bacterium]|nr:hypothetical protein [Parcubacteria group bacterium]
MLYLIYYFREPVYKYLPSVFNLAPYVAEVLCSSWRLYNMADGDAEVRKRQDSDNDKNDESNHGTSILRACLLRSALQ